MARYGPPPDPNALRRDRDAGSWIDLPAEGRPGPPPAFPLLAVTDRELDLWAGVWTRPQAVMWERLRLEFEVALYVRRLTEVEIPGSSASLGSLVRQMAESLGLSVAGVLRNRWRIASPAGRLDGDTDDVAEHRCLRQAFDAGRGEA